MARTAINIIVLHPDTSDYVEDAAVTIQLRPSGTNATVYSTETGSGTISQPLATDAQGRVPGWLDRGRYQAGIDVAGFPQTVEYFDVATAEDGSVVTAWIANLGVTTGKIDNLAVTSGKLDDLAVTAAKLNDNSVTEPKLGTGAVTTNKIAAGAIDASKLAESITSALLPTGSITATARSTAPTGYLLCDGAVISRTTYADLFTAIGTNYGAGNGTTTFGLPDLRDRVPFGRGVATTSDTLGETGGVAAVTLTAAQSGLPAHNHTQDAHNHVQNAHDHSDGVPNNIAYYDDDGDWKLEFIGGNGSVNFYSGDVVISNTASNQSATATNNVNTAIAATASHINLPPYQVVNYIIKT